MLLIVKSLIAALGMLPVSLLPSSISVRSVPPRFATEALNSPVKVLLERTRSVRRSVVKISLGMLPETLVPVMLSRTRFVACAMAEEIVPVSFVLPPRYKFWILLE